MKTLPWARRRHYHLMFTAFFGFLLLVLGGNPNAKAASSLELNWKQGDVFIAAPGSSETAASFGSVLQVGDTLRTGPNSKAEVLTPHGAFRLAPNTAIRVDRTDTPFVLTQLHGKTYHNWHNGQGEGEWNTQEYQVMALGNMVKLSGAGAFDLSVNPAAKRINVNALDKTLLLTLPTKKPAERMLKEHEEITVDEQAITVVDHTISSTVTGYYSTDWLHWFFWNQAQDSVLQWGREVPQSGAWIVTWQQDDIFVKSPDQPEYRSMFGLWIQPGDILRTGLYGKAEIATPDRVIRLGNNTAIRLDRMDDNHIVFTQLYGRTYHRSRVTTLDIAPSTYQIKAFGNTIELPGAGSLDLSVRRGINQINVKAIDGSLSVTLPGKTPEHQILDTGHVIKVDALGTAITPLPLTYTKSDWFLWNQAQDYVLGYDPIAPTPNP